MNTIKGNKIWQIIYPVGIYYVVSSLVFFALQLILGDDSSTYMLRQMICSAATIPFTLSVYREDRKIEETVFGKKEKWFDFCFVRNALLSVIAAAAFGIAVNNAIAMTPLIEVSTGFQEANEAFFAGTFAMELLGSCLVVPIAEELLFRGVVFRKIRLMAGSRAAIVGSALLFASVHVNLVQFLYAALVGALLAFLVERTGNLAMAVLGHMAANMVAVIRSETGWLDFSYEADVAGIGFTLVMFGLAAAIVWYIARTQECRE